MIRDSEFKDDTILQFIRSDAVGRNQYLNTFISALNSVNKSTYISIDANWGAGKTVFMKQIEYINYCPLENFSAPDLEDIVLSSFQDKYVVFYYNAWENDHHDDPLQSLLFSLIDKLYTDDKRIAKVKALVTQAAKSIAKEALKSLTKGIVDVDKISDVTTVEDLVSSITAVNDRKQAISGIISQVLPDNKKLLLIIDELDRCNPEFAMRLLEVAKHYYNDDAIVFVLSTNNRQLVHTVRKYYGDDFDGYGYLDKLYDLILELPPVDIDKYFQNVLKVPNDNYYVNMTPVIIARHLGMTMREANRYYALFSFLKGQLTGGRLGSDDTVTAPTHYVFIPFALALKVKNIELYDKFIEGGGEQLVRNLYASSSVLANIGTHNNNNQDQKAVDIAVECYKSLINSASMSYDQSNYSLMQAGEFFRKVLPLMASVSNIDVSEQANELAAR